MCKGVCGRGVGTWIDEFVVPAARCIVGCHEAQQTSGKRVAHVEAVILLFSAHFR